MIPTASALVRVLETVRRYYRLNGYSPSYREIAILASVSIGRIHGYLDQLQAQGYLTHRGRESRSIALVDRFANASDVELEAACHGRNWTILKPPAAATAIGEAFQADTDCPADFTILLGQIR